MDTRQLRQEVNQHTSKKFNVFEAFTNQQVSQTKSNHVNELPELARFCNDANVMINVMNKNLQKVQNETFHIASDMRNIKDDIKKVSSWHGNAKPMFLASSEQTTVLSQP